MGIDYSGVGGVGIEISRHKVYEKVAKHFNDYDPDENDIDDYLYNVFYESDNVNFEYAGNTYSNRDLTYYLFVNCNKYSELKDMVPKFLEELKTYGLEYTEEDLEIISDHIVS